MLGEFRPSLFRSGREIEELVNEGPLRATINTLVAELGDGGNRAFYEQRALELGAETLPELHQESITYCTAHPGTNATKHFAYMIEHRRSGEGRRKV
jgi:hypothetical protein